MDRRAERRRVKELKRARRRRAKVRRDEMCSPGKKPRAPAMFGGRLFDTFPPRPADWKGWGRKRRTKR